MAECQQNTAIALLQKEVGDLKHALYGNGKPGKLGEIDNELKQISEKISQLKLIFATLAGVAGAGIGAGATTVFKILFGAA
jgi:hypothetical protein